MSKIRPVLRYHGALRLWDAGTAAEKLSLTPRTFHDKFKPYIHRLILGPDPNVTKETRYSAEYVIALAAHYATRNIVRVTGREAVAASFARTDEARELLDDEELLFAEAVRAASLPDGLAIRRNYARPLLNLGDPMAQKWYRLYGSAEKPPTLAVTRFNSLVHWVRPVGAPPLRTDESGAVQP